MLTKGNDKGAEEVDRMRETVDTRFLLFKTDVTLLRSEQRLQVLSFINSSLACIGQYYLATILTYIECSLLLRDGFCSP